MGTLAFFLSKFVSHRKTTRVSDALFSCVLLIFQLYGQGCAPTRNEPSGPPPILSPHPLELRTASPSEPKILPFFSIPQNLPFFSGIASSKITVLLSHQGTLYLGTEGGLSISTPISPQSGGLDFKNFTTANGLLHNGITALLFRGNTLWVGTKKGLTALDRSRPDFQRPVHHLQDQVITAIAQSANALYVGTSEGVLISQDEGQSFRATAREFSPGWITALAIHQRSLVLGTLGRGLFLSDDEGRTFRRPLQSIPHRVTQFASEGNILYLATPRGLFLYHPETERIEAIEHPVLATSEIHSIRVLDRKIYVGTQHLFVSLNGGTTFTQMADPSLRPLLHPNLTSIEFHNRLLWVGSQNGLAWSSDEGSHFQPYLNTGLGDPNITSLESNENTLFVGAKEGLSFSEDEGQHFNLQREIQTTPTHFVRTLGTSGQDLYVGNHFGLFKVPRNQTASRILIGEGVSKVSVSNQVIAIGMQRGGLSLSRDNGVHFRSLLPSQPISSLLVDENSIYAGTRAGLWISRDFQTNFSLSSGTEGLQDTSITAIAKTAHALYVGTLRGIYLSLNDGRSFQRALDGLDLEVTSLLAHENSLFIGTKKGLFISRNAGRTGHLFTTFDGLPDDHITALTLYGSSLYVGTPYGLAKTQEHQLP